MAVPRFALRLVVATPAALALIAGAAGENLVRLLARHQSGEWGDVRPEDARENRVSVEHGFRVLSSYPIGETGAKIWIITEADRSTTCLLLPSEY